MSHLPYLQQRAALVSCAIACLAATAWSQSAPAPTLAVTTPLVAMPAPVNKPAPATSASNNSTLIEWGSLNAQQQAALQPLQSNWNSLSDQQRRKWLSVSTNYPRLSIGEQTKLHERMSQWAALSPRQREHARLNYAEVQKMSPQQKNEKWEAYQALNPTDKQKLAASAQPKPPRTALAIKPAPPGKINQLPLSESPNHVRLPVPMTGVSNKTLLVKPVPPNRPASHPANASSSH